MRPTTNNYIKVTGSFMGPRFVFFDAFNRDDAVKAEEESRHWMSKSQSTNGKHMRRSIWQPVNGLGLHVIGTTLEN